MKKAFITGVSGQDGSYLAELLLRKGYEVFGYAKEGSDLKNVPSDVKIFYGDLGDRNALTAAVNASAPDEVYNLAGVTDLKTAYAFPEMTMKLNFESVGMLFDAALNINPRVRFLQASSSEVFLPSASLLNEDAPRDWETQNPYTKAKLLADRDVVQKSRDDRDAFACSAILFTHESPRRTDRSVIRKTTSTLSRIKLGQASRLTIGNPDSCRDWGFAGDYAEAMWRMLQQDAPEDFVLASGELHTVRDAVSIAAKTLDLELHWKDEGMEAHAVDAEGKTIVDVSPDFYKPVEPNPKVGDIAKAEKILGWKPKIDFQSLVEMMVASDLAELHKI